MRRARIAASLARAFQPGRSLSRTPLFIGLVALQAAVAAAFLAYLWSHGTTVDMAIGGQYQIADAMGYWYCAGSLLDSGSFGSAADLLGGFCERRSLYASLLSGIAAAAGRNILWTLLLQALLLASDPRLAVTARSEPDHEKR